MTQVVTFCVLNYFNEKELFVLSREGVDRENITEENRPLKCKRFLEVNGIDLHYFLKEIAIWSNLRFYLLKTKRFRNDVPILKVIPPDKQPLDYKWNRMLSQILWERIETENLISWLSTLGGGFSALGETFTRHAEIAGKISLQQLSLGLRVGDPFLQARCKLYYSISLIQTGKLRLAKYIIRQQYIFAREQKHIDQKLVNMCEGIWLRLQYAYSQKNANVPKRMDRDSDVSLTQMTSVSSQK